MIYPKIYLDNIIKYSIFFLPIAILSGPFIPDLLVSIVCIIFIYISLSEKLYKYYQNYFFYICSCFYIYLLINSFLSSYYFESLKVTVFYFRFFIFALAVWYVIDQNQNFIKIFFHFFAATYTLALLDGYYQYFFNTNLFGIESPGVRMTLLFNEKLILGGYLSRLFPLLIALMFFCYGNSKRLIIYGMLLLIFSDILIYLTGERTALGLLFLATIIIIICISKYNIARLFTFIISVILIVSISIFSPVIKERNVDYTIEQLGINEIIQDQNTSEKEIFKQNNSEKNVAIKDDNIKLKDKFKLYIFSPAHHSHILTAWNGFLDKPIFGHGANSFRHFCKDKLYSYDNYSCSTHPHNNYIQIISELGIIGLVPFILLNIYLFYVLLSHLTSKYIFRKIKLSDYQICLICSFILTVWPFFPTLNFFNNWINVIYFLPLGFFLQSMSKN